MRRLLLQRPWRPACAALRSKPILSRFPALRMSSAMAPQTQPPESKIPAWAGAGKSEVDNPMFEELALLAPTNVPDDEHGVIRVGDSASRILDNSALVIERKVEMLNIFLGYEQHNRYVIMNPKGEHVGYLAEEEGGMGTMVKRQLLHTHRAFKAHVLDKEGKEVLYIERPIRVINGRIRIHNTENENRVVGEVGQIWAPLRRKYELSVLRDDTFEQFAAINEPFLSWDFSMANNTGNLIGSINRNFRGFGREIFTDTGQYVLRMDAASPETTNIKNSEAVHWFPHRKRQLVLQNPFGRKETIGLQEYERRLDGMPRSVALAHMERVEDLVERQDQSVQADGMSLVAVPRPSVSGLTLDQRAVMLATAVSIDFDYFSRHSGPGDGMFMPLYFPMGSPDPGTAEPGSTGEPATPGLPPDGSNPGTFEDDPGLSGGESGDSGGGYADEEGEWGQQPPPNEESPFQPDDPASKDSGWGSGEGSGSGGSGGGGSGGDGGGGGSWWDIFDQ